MVWALKGLVFPLRLDRRLPVEIHAQSGTREAVCSMAKQREIFVRIIMGWVFFILF